MGNTPPRRASSSSSASASASNAATRELERYTNPTGLYASCPWDVRMARRLILEKRIAPRFPGKDGKESCFTQECPICFMFYPGNLNLSTCCKKPICSECYLQLKPPKKHVSCPYCNNEAFGIKYTAPAVLNVSSIYADKSSVTASTPTTSEAALSPSPTAYAASSAPIPVPVHAPVPVDHSVHFASVEDRARLRDDLRSQLNLTDQPITTPPMRSASLGLPPPSTNPPRLTASASFIIASAEEAARNGEPRYIIASANDAARLEEMMIMEAIRRSMADLTTAKDDEHERNRGVARARAASAASGTGRVAVARRPSFNPLEERSGENVATPPPRPRRDSASWNPFDE